MASYILRTASLFPLNCTDWIPRIAGALDWPSSVCESMPISYCLSLAKSLTSRVQCGYPGYAPVLMDQILITTANQHFNASNGNSPISSLDPDSFIMSTTPTTPSTTTDSMMDSLRLPSSQPSSPPSQPLPDDPITEKQEHPPQAADMEIDDDDVEGMDIKTKGLMNLLKTSSVFVAIMADKMKDQQRQQQEAASRAAAKAQATTDEKPTTTTRKITRGMQKKNDNDDDVIEVEAPAKTKKLATRGRPKKDAGKENIATYFKKADISVDKPTVQEALDQAAEEFEAQPAAIGEQKLVATSQPKLVTGGTMREYQLEGLEWMKTLWMNGLSGILADEMGLGKTVQAISLLAFFREHNIEGPFLIAAPLSTLSNWIDEFARWTPDIPTVLYHASKAEREEVRKDHMLLKDQRKSDFPVVVTSYEICMNDRKFLAQYQWKYIIVVRIAFLSFKAYG